ncbi:predicted protein [Nematostella vectensis]|uniref:GST C-terminal domain-containing protein n=1 Tax=Nematostella vectensis TaxID=45351 RepID=A7RPL0_NEMVE|nr:predicted protein [Nematostella vectensis]|eukprot:XP_001638590.1 predicted protein [Nematostella vectensis]
MADNSSKMFDSKTLVLRIFPRFAKLPVPSISPSCLKLETYARMANIQYHVNTACENIDKVNMPAIEYDDKVAVHSARCIPYLNERYGVELDRDLSEEQKATATTITAMLDEHTSWTLHYHRWCSDYAKQYKDELMYGLNSIFRKIAFCVFKSDAQKKLEAQGIGRHTEAEVYSLAERDLRAVSTLLGDKPYLFGDRPVEADASLFGIVANVIWTMQGSPQEKLVSGELPNLADHAQRIKKEFYPDWDEVIKSDTFESGKKK